MALRDEMELWAKQNLRSVEDYYEVMRGIQDAADDSVLAGGYGDYVFRHTAKALKKTAKEVTDPHGNRYLKPRSKLKAKLLK